MEPDDALAERAQTRALAALRGGAKLTGRVSIPDEPEFGPLQSRALPVWRYGPIAAAAAIILAFTVIGLSHFSGPNQPVLVKNTLEADKGPGGMMSADHGPSNQPRHSAA